MKAPTALWPGLSVEAEPEHGRLSALRYRRPERTRWDHAQALMTTHGRRLDSDGHPGRTGSERGLPPSTPTLDEAGERRSQRRGRHLLLRVPTPRRRAFTTGTVAVKVMRHPARRAPSAGARGGGDRPIGDPRAKGSAASTPRMSSQAGRQPAGTAREPSTRGNLAADRQQLD